MIDHNNPRHRQLIDLPSPNCKKCHGRGRVIRDRVDLPQVAVPCRCLFRNKVLQNLKKTWEYMATRVVPVKGGSPLLELARDRKFARITADPAVMAAHLHFTIVQRCFELDDPYWWVEVTNDKEIVEAWLYTAKFLGQEIHDADVALAEIHADSARSIKDLAMRAHLMVVQIGKKVAANKETKTTLREAIDYRIDHDKLTWIVDTPRDRLDDPSVLAHSIELVDDLAKYGFVHVDLSEEKATVKGPSSGILEVSQLEDPFENVRPIVSKGTGKARATVTADDLMAEEAAKQQAHRKKVRKSGGRKKK